MILEPNLCDSGNIAVRRLHPQQGIAIGANIRETVVCGAMVLRGDDDVQALWTAGFGLARGAGGTGGNGRTLRADLGGPRGGGRGTVSCDQPDGQGAGAGAA